MHHDSPPHHHYLTHPQVRTASHAMAGASALLGHVSHRGNFPAGPRAASSRHAGGGVDGAQFLERNYREGVATYTVNITTTSTL